MSSDRGAATLRLMSNSSFGVCLPLSLFGAKTVIAMPLIELTVEEQTAAINSMDSELRFLLEEKKLTQRRCQ